MKKWLTLPVLLVFMTACNDGTDEIYNTSLEDGLDYIAAEDFIRAEVYFEQALDARPDDQRTINLIYQIQHYQKAVEHFDREQFDESLEELDHVIDTENGSAGMVSKAQNLSSSVQLEMDNLVSEAGSEDIEAEKLVDNDEKDNSLPAEQPGGKSEENVSEDDADQNESEEDMIETDTSGDNHTPSLEDYSIQEIEYARVLLMTDMVDPESSTIYVSHYPAGTPVADGYEDTVKFPDPTTVLHGEYGYSGSITYTSHGDGNITIYPMPSHWHQEDQSPEGYRTFAQEILDGAETVYVEPGNNRDIINTIDRVIFDYSY